MIEHINFRRVFTFICIICTTILFTFFLGYYERMYIDEWYCLFFIDALFLLVFIFELEYSRSKAQLAANRNSYFVKIAVGYFVSLLFTAIFVLLPTFCRPVIVIVLLMLAFSNELIAILCGSYCIIMLSVAVSGDYYELLSQIFIIVIGSIIAQTIYDKRLKIFSYILFVCFNVMVPIIFYYWEFREWTSDIMIYGLICGLVGVAVQIVCDRFVKPFADAEVHSYMMDMLSDDYSLVVELKHDSSNEFEHAKRVSNIAYKCAQYANLNADLCGVAGFYYRLGKWLGESSVEAGVRKAQEMCFPAEIIYILSEYYGEKELPSTPESALVHIVDALVKKLESISSEVGKSAWNNDMIIYQTLNEFSASGLYDKSGLGMNHFLKIREYLAKEKLF